MQAEEAVKIEHGLARNVDAGPHRVILRLAIRHHNIQTVGRPTLEDHHQALGARTRLSRTHCGASKKTRHGRRPDDRKRTVAKKNPTCNGHKNSSQLLATSVSKHLKAKTKGLAGSYLQLSPLKLQRAQQQSRNRAHIRRTRCV